MMICGTRAYGVGITSQQSMFAKTSWAHVSVSSLSLFKTTPCLHVNYSRRESGN